MKEILAALATIQTACESPKKKSRNDHFGNKYANLEQVLGVLHEPLESAGMGVLQMPVTTEQGAGVRTTLFLATGETMDCGEFILPLPTKGPQAVGIAVTYARRYSLMAIFRLSAEDDDAETAEGRGKNKPKAEPKRTLEDVAPEPTEDPLTVVLACGIQYDGKAAPALPKGAIPVIPDGKKHAGQSMDTVPVGYIRSIYKDIPKDHAHKPWAEYFIKAHAFSKLNGGE